MKNVLINARLRNVNMRLHRIVDCIRPPVVTYMVAENPMNNVSDKNTVSITNAICVKYILCGLYVKTYKKI